MLNDLELDVVATKAMRFSEKSAMDYLKDKGHNISRRTYYYTLGHISSETRKRSFEIAKSFLEDHMNIIDELEYTKKMIYDDIKNEEDPYKKTMMRMQIVHTLIPFTSAYKEATKRIIEKVKKEIANKEENIDLSFT